MSYYQRIENDFKYHSPSEFNREIMINIRFQAKALAHLIDELVPDCREKSLALTHLEEVSMWANAGIARNQDV